jgi:peptidoglycan biosynthesis protein MviN/MurJ (putative lipid II flippase)
MIRPRVTALAGASQEDVSRRWEQILQELRVTQTGTQIISGFLLSVAFQQMFTKLPGHARAIYLVLVVLACVATLLGLLPVVQHRKRPERDPDRRLVATCSRILIALLLLVTLLAIGVAVFIFDVVLGGVAALVAGVVALIAGILIWVLPAHAHVWRSKHGRETAVTERAPLSRSSR